MLLKVCSNVRIRWIQTSKQKNNANSRAKFSIIFGVGRIQEHVFFVDFWIRVMWIMYDFCAKPYLEKRFIFFEFQNQTYLYRFCSPLSPFPWDLPHDGCYTQPPASTPDNGPSKRSLCFQWAAPQTKMPRRRPVCHGKSRRPLPPSSERMSKFEGRTEWGWPNLPFDPASLQYSKVLSIW